MITITNHGPLITDTDYWQSEYAAAGKLIISPNAGAIRCLLPPSLYPVIGDLRSCEYAICSVGDWSPQRAAQFGLSLPIRGQAVEILWEDHTDSPHAWHVSAESCILIPGDPSPHQWVVACWIDRRGVPHKSIERPCRWQRAKLPAMGVAS